MGRATTDFLTMASPKEILEGKPIRSPLHPALVHLPVALFPISLLLDGVSWWWQGAAAGAVRAAFGCVMAGLATGVLAAIFGFVDFSGIRRDHPAKKTAIRHMVVNLGVLGVFGVSAYLRWPALDALKTGIVPLVLSVVGVAGLGYSGYLGGDMVYNDGIGVGRHRRRTPVPVETITRRPARRPDTGLISVAEETALRDGETLRVDAMGTVMTIARVEGVLYAVQEFCTHRYGPLSEGKLRGCEIVCPWHSSHFDLRSGQPTSGPATVGLRTFRVETREGKIWVEAPGRK